MKQPEPLTPAPKQTIPAQTTTPAATPTATPNPKTYNNNRGTLVIKRHNLSTPRSPPRDPRLDASRIHPPPMMSTSVYELTSVAAIATSSLATTPSAARARTTSSDLANNTATTTTTSSQSAIGSASSSRVRSSSCTTTSGNNSSNHPAATTTTAAAGHKPLMHSPAKRAHSCQGVAGTASLNAGATNSITGKMSNGNNISEGQARRKLSLNSIFASPSIPTTTTAAKPPAPATSQASRTPPASQSVGGCDTRKVDDIKIVEELMRLDPSFKHSPDDLSLLYISSLVNAASKKNKPLTADEIPAILRAAIAQNTQDKGQGPTPKQNPTAAPKTAKNTDPMLRSSQLIVPPISEKPQQQSTPTSCIRGSSSSSARTSTVIVKAPPRRSVSEVSQTSLSKSQQKATVTQVSTPTTNTNTLSSGSTTTTNTSSSIAATTKPTTTNSSSTPPSGGLKMKSRPKKRVTISEPDDSSSNSEVGSAECAPIVGPLPKKNPAANNNNKAETLDALTVAKGALEPQKSKPQIEIKREAKQIVDSSGNTSVPQSKDPSANNNQPAAATSTKLQASIVTSSGCTRTDIASPRAQQRQRNPHAKYPTQQQSLAKIDLIPTNLGPNMKPNTLSATAAFSETMSAGQAILTSTSQSATKETHAFISGNTSKKPAPIVNPSTAATLSSTISSNSPPKNQVNGDGLNKSASHLERTYRGWQSDVGPPFYWDQYLELKPAKVAAREAFFQNPLPLENKFEINMKLEARDPRNEVAWCLATVMDLAGARIRLRFDGNDNTNDFYSLIDSADIRPVGSGEPLSPPIAYKYNITGYRRFVDKTLTRDDIKLAPKECFLKPPTRPKKNLFEVGMKLEAIDRKNPHLICAATIGSVEGDDVKIEFDGWKGSFDYVCKYYSRELFPINWARDTLVPWLFGKPNGWENMLNALIAQAAASGAPSNTVKSSPPSSSTGIAVPSSSSNNVNNSLPPVRIASPAAPTAALANEGTKKSPSVKAKKTRGRPRKDEPGNCSIGFSPQTPNASSRTPTAQSTPKRDRKDTSGGTAKSSNTPDTPKRIIASIMLSSSSSSSSSSPQNSAPASPSSAPGTSPDDGDLDTGNIYQCQRTVPYSEWKRLKDGVAAATPGSSGEQTQAKDAREVKQDEPEHSESPTKKKVRLETPKEEQGDQGQEQQQDSPSSSFNKKPITVEDVINLLKTDDSLAKYSEMFESNEIDGKALLMLTSDVMINYMGLKIGPVLKIVDLIEKVKHQK